MAFHKAKALQDAEKSVAQGKIGQAIKLYQEILDNDPSDVSLLNTVGDLYVRDRNIAEGLRQFHKLAEAYVRDGFNVKAIAIYRKITKVDPNTVETLLKLAELYQLQGLSREAREQFLQATEFFKKRNQSDRALEVLRKVVQLDPENLNFRNRLATESEQMGKREEAAQAYLDVAEIMLRRDDKTGAEAALKKAADMNPKNSKVQMMRARVAIAREKPEEAESILTSSPEFVADPEGRRILLEAYLASRKLPQAEKLVLEVFHGNSSDFTPVAHVSALLVENGDTEEAFKLLTTVAAAMISQNNAGPLLEPLLQIWHRAPKHIPTMELIHQVCERTADESTLPVVLEALGRAHEEAGDLEKAEAAYLKLVEREQENENFRGLLNALQRKLGRDIKPVDFASREMALVADEETTREPPRVDAQQAAMVKEALENSDLFSRYNLVEKAIAELEKVLQVYPDQVEIHRRILEISRKGLPERAAVAAAHLARITTEHGDHETASRYEAIASAKGGLHEIPLPPPPVVKKVEEPAIPAPAATPATVVAPAAPPESHSTEEFLLVPLPVEEPLPAAVGGPLPEPVSFDLTPADIAAALPPPAAPPEQMTELDLSGDLEAMGAMGFESPVPAAPEHDDIFKAGIPAVLEIPPPLDILAPEETLAPQETQAPPEIPTQQELPPVEFPVSAQEPTTPPVAEEAPIIDIPIELELPPAELMEATTIEEPAVVEDVPVEQPAAAETTADATTKHAVPTEEVIPADLEDSRIEVEFYLENGFVDEARTTMVALEQKYPGSRFVAELREIVDARLGKAVAAEAEEGLASADEGIAPEPKVTPEPEITSAPAAEPVLAEQAAATESPESKAPEVKGTEEVLAAEPKLDASPEPASEEWELPTSYALTIEEESAPDLAEHGAAVPKGEPSQVAEASSSSNDFSAVPEETVAADANSVDLLGDLAGDFAATLDGIASPSETLSSSPPPARTPSAAPVEGAAHLSGLLAEMEEPGHEAAAAAKEDPETHYNLGVAFREMGLLDEAIGEFQKVVKGGGKGNFPPNYLQACSLLAICFMEKRMPAIAAKWYIRALETPGLEEEATLALQYDLGVAYEQSGDSRSALERFTEVYSQNIDFRDVADKIRELQQKA